MEHIRNSEKSDMGIPPYLLSQSPPEPGPTGTSAASAPVIHDSGLNLLILSHEVRNPLTNINLATAVLDTKVVNDDDRVYLDIIKRSALRITLLINELLRQQETELVTLEKYSILQLIEDVILLVQDRMSIKNISLIKDLPQPGYDVPMNKAKMKIALTNIIINAIEAITAQEGGELRITSRWTDGKYTLYIGDNGCGISTIHLKNIFKPYFSRKPGGLGIGLAASHAILLSNHVAVHVDSVEGQGTCFVLTFENFPETA